MAGEIFISYRRSDLAHARRLHELLKAEGIEAWYDAQVGAGQDWRQATASALSKSRVFVLLFSKAASESEDIAKELAAATLSKKLIVPVRLQNIQPEGAFLYELAARNWIDAYQDTDARLVELAKNLAAVVKEGAGADSIVQFERGRSAQGGRRFRPALMLAGAGVAAAVLIAAVVLMTQGGGRSEASATPTQRVAFFGVSAPPQDTAAVAIAEKTTSDVFETLSAVQLETVARLETEDIEPGLRIDRALDHKALYAVSGSVTRQGNKTAITMQVDDVPSRTTLWTRAVDAEDAEAETLAVRAAAMTTDLLRCVADIRSELKRDDIKVVSKLPAACLAIRQGGGTDQKRWRELVDLAPESPYLNAMAGVSLANNIERFPQVTREDVRKDAISFIDKAIELDENHPETQLGRVLKSILNEDTLVEQEKVYLDGIKRSPSGANINAWYCWFLNDVGRARASLDYCRTGLQAEPLSAPKMFGVATIYATLGYKADAEALFQRTNERAPSRDLWHRRLAAAATQEIGDLHAILAAPPSGLPAEALACGKDVFAGLKDANAQTRRPMSEAAQRCVRAGVLNPNTALIVYGWVGDMDAAYDFVSEQSLPYRTLFTPELAAFRKDERFEAEAMRLGLVDYWRETGHTPDFCATEKAPVCALIAAK